MKRPASEVAARGQACQAPGDSRGLRATGGVAKSGRTGGAVLSASALGLAWGMTACGGGGCRRGWGDREMGPDRVVRTWQLSSLFF